MHDLPFAVGIESCRARRAWMKLNAVERRRRNRTKPRILPHRRILRELPQFVPATEVLVDARVGEAIESGDGAIEAVRVDAEPCGKAINGVGALDPIRDGTLGREAGERKSAEIGRAHV